MNLRPERCGAGLGCSLANVGPAGPPGRLPHGAKCWRRVSSARIAPKTPACAPWGWVRILPYTTEYFPANTPEE